MKRIISVLLITAMLFSMLIATIPLAAEDSGFTSFDAENVGNNVVTDANRNTYSVPAGAIAISSKNGLKNMQNNKYYYLTADITLSAGEAATYASGVSVLTGITLDGCGYKITLNNASLFSKTKDITVKNITFEGAITANDNSNYHILNSGDVQGYTNLENVTASVDFTVTNKQNRKSVGALSPSLSNSTVKNVLNEGNVTVTQATTKIDAIGGIFGKANRTTFVNVVNKGSITVANITSPSQMVIGGIVGYATESSFTNCVNSGAITNSAKLNDLGDVYIGGITAYTTTYTKFNNCSNIGDITITLNGTVTALGGIVAMIFGEGAEFNACSNAGVIEMKQLKSGQSGESAVTVEPKDVGMGIAGILGVSRAKNISFKDCSNSANITTVSRGKVGVGGILGYQYCTSAIAQSLSIEDCSNSGNIDEIGAGAMLGGIVGSIRGIVSTVIQDVTNSGDVTVSPSANFNWRSAAGICGFYGSAGGKMVNNNTKLVTLMDFYSCSNTGNITNSSHAGGILGRSEEIDCEMLYTTFYNCINKGAISATNGMSAGIYGQPNSRGYLNIEWCINEGNITASGSGGVDKDAGGIISTTGKYFTSIIISKTKNSGEVNAVDKAGGIAARTSQEPVISERGKVLIENCLNEGKVYSGSRVLSLAAGIIAYSKSSVTIRGCINKGAVSALDTANGVPITYDGTLVSEAKDNYYLSGKSSATSAKVGEAKSSAQIEQIVSKMTFQAKNNPYNLTKLYEQAITYYPQDHTEDSWAPMAVAIEKASTLLSNPNSAQEDMDSAVEELKIALGGLVLTGEQDFTKLEIAIARGEELGIQWESFSWLDLFVAIRDGKAIINLDEEEKVKLLQSEIDKAEQRINQAIADLLEKPPLQGDIDVDEKGQMTMQTLRPEVSGTTASENTETKNSQSTDETVEIDLGCSGLIGGGVVIATAIAVLSAGMLIKKKED